MSYPDCVDQIARAILYEGYLLYPYRASAVKNQQRWTFGGIYPQSYSQAKGETDPWTMQTECLLEIDREATLTIKVRFLHLVERTVCKLAAPQFEWNNAGKLEYERVESLTIDEEVHFPWQEAREQEVVAAFVVGDVPRAEEVAFSFPASRHLEPLTEPNGAVVGMFVREQQPISGVVKFRFDPLEEGLGKSRIVIQNLTPFPQPLEALRENVLLQSLISTHTIGHLDRSGFVSLLEPPEKWNAYAANCQNQGAWPVLVGEVGERHTMLSSPIILYDYPQVAPESPGDFFDATEIDEMLTLRIMTMTDQEKREMQLMDERAGALLRRTESLAREQMMKLHGAVRGLRPLTQEADHE